MALDHYVSQVHLRKFNAPALDFRKMYAFRKSDLKSFICDSRDVCRIDEGSTNQFLPDPRVVEDFLKSIEPYYTASCSALEDNKPTFEAVRVIAGFIAFIIGCSPTAMRLGSVSFEKLVHAEAALLDEQGLLEPAPAILGGRTLSELLADGNVEVTIDEKFPQAFGIAGVIENQNSFASFSWELLHNRYAEKTPFVTSDFPAAIERSIDPRIANRVVPLRSDFAVRIHPQLRSEGRPDLPSDFRYKVHYPSPSEIITINKTIVRNAENLVFSPVDTPALRGLIKRNARFYLELDHQTIPATTGRFLLNRMVVRQRSAV